MRHYFILGGATDSETSDALEVFDYDLKGFDHLRMFAGIRIGFLPSNLKFYVNADSKGFDSCNVIVNSIGWTVLSEELANAVKSVAGDSVELLGVPVYTSKEIKVEKQFYVINSLKKINAIS